MTALILLRHDPTRGWWATTRQTSPVPLGWTDYFSYDSAFFPTKTAALREARAFCRWKHLRVQRIVRKEE